jgi:hypothetical protein
MEKPHRTPPFLPQFAPADLGKVYTLVFGQCSQKNWKSEKW